MGKLRHKILAKLATSGVKLGDDRWNEKIKARVKALNIIDSIDGLGMKPCSKCGVPKELSEFSKRKSSKDGYRIECKLCISEQNKKYYEASKERYAERNKEWRKANKERDAERKKEYYEANKERDAERKKEYYEANKERHAERAKEWRKANKERHAERKKEWRKANKDRVAGQNKEWRKANKERHAERKKEYYEANKERIAEQGKEYYEANKERCVEQAKEYYEANKERCVEQNKEWRKANKERCVEQAKEWRKANPDKVRSSNARRRSIKLQAYPPWAAILEKRQIEEIYTLARMQSEATGKEYHVDHIHPLQAPKKVMFEGEMIPLICGLNVPANLQILEASINLSKNNKFEPYIESECDFTELWQVKSDDRTLIPTPIDRIPRRNPSALIKPRKNRGVSKGQLALF